MERREALIKTSWILKSAFLTPTLLSFLQSCQETVSRTKNQLILDDKQDNLVKAIADCIIPRTKTPSASDVGVNKFIDLLLTDVFNKEVRQQFLTGLDEFDKECQLAMGKKFAKLSTDNRNEYLENFDKKVMSKTYEDTVPFYYTFKHLTITSYFSTEEGVKQNLNYVPVPGTYKGEVPYTEGDKIMIGNSM